MILPTRLIPSTLLTLFICAAAVLADDKDLPPSGEVKPQLYATGFEFAEGPALDDKGNLFVVNYRGKGNIGRITPEGSASVWCTLSELAPAEGRTPQANGLKLDYEKRLIVADSGAGRLLRISNDGKRAEVLADRWEGQHFHSVNDVALDIKGNLYFTDPGESTKEQPSGSVYRYDINTERVSRVASGMAFPNGLAVTPDQKSLVVAESLRRRIVRVPLNAKNAPVTMLIEFPPFQGGGDKDADSSPGGMVFDHKGRLFVAMWNEGVIYVVDPTGKIIRKYKAGGEKTTNCHFHGDFLYTTIAEKEAVFRLNLGVKGFRYNGASQ